MDTLIQFAALLGVGLLIFAGVIALLERHVELVLDEGRIRRAKSVRAKRNEAANQRIDAMRKRLEHPGFIGWQEEWSWRRS